LEEQTRLPTTPPLIDIDQTTASRSIDASGNFFTYVFEVSELLLYIWKSIERWVIQNRRAMYLDFYTYITTSRYQIETEEKFPRHAIPEIRSSPKVMGTSPDQAEFFFYKVFVVQ
jgi:hypothetical protein